MTRLDRAGRQLTGSGSEDAGHRIGDDGDIGISAFTFRCITPLEDVRGERATP